MTRDELIDILAKHGASLDGWDWDSNTTLNGNSVDEEHTRYREWVADTLTAIEAAGLCMVPVEATEAMQDAAQTAWTPGVSHFEAHAIRYRAMIEAGKL